MYKYLLVILDKGAVPFCYYGNPYYHSLSQPAFMPLEIVEKVVHYARNHDLFVNFLYGKNRLPPEYEKIIDTISHVNMIPLCLKDIYRDGVLVLDADDCELFTEIGKNRERSIILRVAKHNLRQVAEIFASLQGKFIRLNLHLIGLESFTAKDLDVYEEQLKKISELLQQNYKAGEEMELNVLSDRILLKQMNNCDAGIKHLTIAPNGKAYVCPAFYYDDEENAVGIWTEDQEVASNNQQLLDISCAPICSHCDAFHCKRCVYLNKLTTLEINVPSKEQCLVAHREREISRQMLNRLRGIKPFDKLPAITGLSYQDPFEVVVQSIWDQPTPAIKRSATLDSDEYLIQIYEMQKQILRKLGTD